MNDQTMLVECDGFIYGAAGDRLVILEELSNIPLCRWTERIVPPKYDVNSNAVIRRRMVLIHII